MKERNAMRHSRMTSPVAHGEHKPYGKATYRQIGGPNGHLAKREPFEGHSMRAQWETEFLYVVRSYDQIIAEWFHFSPEGKRVEIDPQNLYGHSHTTSRHIGMCIAWLKD